MGCWNETCLLTGAPIRWGNPVVAFFVSRYIGESIESGLSLASLPIYGTYNDYGSVENIEPSEGNELAVQYFKKNLVDPAEHGDPVSIEKFGIEDFVNLAERASINCATMKTSGQFPKQFGLVMMHRAAFDEFLRTGDKINFDYMAISSEGIGLGELWYLSEIGREYNRLHWNNENKFEAFKEALDDNPLKKEFDKAYHFRISLMHSRILLAIAPEKGSQSYEVPLERRIAFNKWSTNFMQDLLDSYNEEYEDD